MRRALIASGVAGLCALTAVLVWKSSAAQLKEQAPVAVATAGQLPISQVVLFSSGVGYFQREGDVTGTSRVDLTFPIQDINDLIKSMVVQDLGGGRVSTVSYDSQAPVEKTLRSFAVNLTSNPSFGQILNQARGEKVEVILQQTNVTQPATIAGVVLGVEQQRQSAGKDAVEVALLNLWCAEGMRSVKLAEVQRVRFLNPVLDAEMKKALEVLATSHDTQKKSVSLHFTGEGKRGVRVGYVVENPIWKTSYRLVLDKKQRPFLQGWAVVENTQDEDWNGVRMALVSGRPISFQMNLYDPLFVSRPMVEPELFASLRPPTYSGAMDSRWGAMANNLGGGFGGQGGFPGSGGLSNGEPRKEAEGNKKPDDKATNYNVDAIRLLMNERMDLEKGVASVAAAVNLGDFFQYLIDQPVTLPRQKSALLPIINQEVDADRVSIYNEETHAKFPLLGLRFKNTTNLHLMQGPITVFETGSYAGDARIENIQPKEDRLLSYAIDLGVEVEPVTPEPAAKLTSVKIHRGVIQARQRIRQSKIYNVKNRTEQDRAMVIEHPFDEQFKLIAPEKPAERARDVYRFELKVAAGKTGKLEVIEEHDVLNTYEVRESDDNIRLFLTNPIASQKVKDALQKIIDQKGKLAIVRRDLGHANQQLKDIGEDQARLRANLREMPPTAAAYKRYLDKFDRQESDIETLRDRIKKLQEAELQQQKGLDDYLTSLDLE